MSEYLVAVERDSVCMGDDVNAPHRYRFKLRSDADFNEVFAHLASKSYLAQVAGDSHFWEVFVDKTRLAIFLRNNKSPEPSNLLSHNIANYTNDGCLNLTFRYRSEIDCSII
ncbi:hypothetical protein [Enterovibrio norvegicus]|uniref:hypothetical protein n=1 Tax=Enterovibrio norvegicus TaxID=188144 RepID=UPI0010554932|nr:hypothetical protein [Enterovibrio norvegicus]